MKIHSTRKLFPLLLLLAVTTTPFAQTAPVPYWDKTFGGDDYDGLEELLPLPGGSYLLAGSSLSGLSGDRSEPARTTGSSDYWVVKMDAAGNKVWDKSFGGTGSDFLNKLVPASDGGFLLAGTTSSGIGGDKTQVNKGGYDFWVVKMDAAGNKLWDKGYGGTSSDELFTAIATADGGYLLGGVSRSGISGDKTQAGYGSNDFWIVKIDGAGNKQWDKTFGGIYEDNLGALMATADGGYLLSGHSNSTVSGNKTTGTFGNYDFWLVKINAAGTKLWEKTYGGTDADQLNAFVSLPGGGYLLAGQSASAPSGNKIAALKGSTDYWLVKIDAAGTLQWDQSFGGSDMDILTSVLVTAEKDLLLGGYSRSGIGGDKSAAPRGMEDFWLIKTDSTGAKRWDVGLGGYDDDRLHGLAANANGDLLVAGYTSSGVANERTDPLNGYYDMWVVQLVPPATVQTGALSGATFCTGTKMTVPFTTTGSFAANNVFTLQLSDDNGSFATPVNLGTLASNAASGSFEVTLPHTIEAGAYFRVRVVASARTTGITDNGSDFRIRESPAVQLAGIPVVCAGHTLNLAVNTPFVSTYRWTGPNGYTATTQDLTINGVQPAHAGRYTITLTDLAGCASTDSVNVTVHALPAAFTGTNQEMCAGGEVTLGAAGANGNTYSWSSNPAGFTSSHPNLVVRPSATTTYTLTETVTATGCSKTGQATVQVNPVPAIPTITAMGGTTICAGSQVQLYSSASAGNQWYKDGVQISGATFTGYKAEEAGTYQVRATERSCASGTSSGTTVFVTPLPATPVITAVGNVLTSSATAGNQWYLNESLIAGAAGSEHRVQASGTYTVKTTQNNCTATSLPFTFAATRLADPAAWNGAVQVFPNPVRDLLYISNLNNRKLAIRVLDVLGQVVLEKGLLWASGTLEMKDLPAGVYVVLVTDLQKKETLQKMVTKQ